MSDVRPDDARAAEVLRAIGHPARLAILRRLLRGDSAVGEIEAELDIQQPALSQHLGALRGAGLLRARRDSRSVIYGFADEASRRICAAVLASFAPDAAETTPPAPRQARPESALFAILRTRQRD